MPVGGALGYTIGGVLGTEIHWRAAFLVCGAPGTNFGEIPCATIRVRDDGIRWWEKRFSDLFYNVFFVIYLGLLLALLVIGIKDPGTYFC